MTGYLEFSQSKEVS